MVLILMWNHSDITNYAYRLGASPNRARLAHTSPAPFCLQHGLAPGANTAL